MSVNHKVYKLTVSTLEDNNPVSKEVLANFVDLTGDDLVNNYLLTKRSYGISLPGFPYPTYEVP